MRAGYILRTGHRKYFELSLVQMTGLHIVLKNGYYAKVNSLQTHSRVFFVYLVLYMLWGEKTSPVALATSNCPCVEREISSC